MATDWNLLRVEYVTSSITMRELADKHGINASGIMRRAANEKWESERKKESAKVITASLESSVIDRSAELEAFNAEDLAMAKAIRAKASAMMEETTTPQDLKALSGAIDTAQKVGRLALGANTESSIITTRSLDPIADDEFLG